MGTTSRLGVVECNKSSKGVVTLIIYILYLWLKVLTNAVDCSNNTDNTNASICIKGFKHALSLRSCGIILFVYLFE